VHLIEERRLGAGVVVEVSVVRVGGRGLLLGLLIGAAARGPSGWPAASTASTAC
jgi:hypothetical protein